MLVWSYWPEPEGGAERQCRLLVQELTGRGHCCVIFTSRTALRPPRLQPSSDVFAVNRFGLLCPLEKRVRRSLSRMISSGIFAQSRWSNIAGFWLSAPFVWISRLSFILALFFFAFQFKKPPIDLLHVHESGWLAGVGVALARRWKIPVIVKEATSPPLAPISYGTPSRYRWDRLRRTADGWIAQTNEIIEKLVLMDLPAEQIHLLPNGVIVPTISASQNRSDSILYVGNLTQGSAWKAFDVLFEAWVQVVKTKPSAQLMFVGSGDSAPWVNYLKKYKMEHTVRFVGFVENPAKYYAAATIFVLPSRIEGMSNALLEAQSWGLACVVSDIPANTAIVQHDFNGLVVPVNNSEALAKAITQLLGDRQLRERLGQKARDIIIDAFDIKYITNRLLEIYKTLGVVDPS